LLHGLFAFAGHAVGLLNCSFESIILAEVFADGVGLLAGQQFLLDFSVESLVHLDFPFDLVRSGFPVFEEVFFVFDKAHGGVHGIDVALEQALVVLDLVPPLFSFVDCVVFIEEIQVVLVRLSQVLVLRDRVEFVGLVFGFT